MKTFLLYFSLVTHACFSQVNVILDADIDSDVDDVAALAMLHQLHKNKEIKLLGVVVTSDDPYAVLCADAINSYFGNNVPIGFQQNRPALKNHSRYTRQISEEFPHTLKSHRDAMDAVALYRKLLIESPDHSVTIVTIGHLTSLQDLLRSEGDNYSSQKGKELALQKVSKWICMGGMFPSGKEANFYRPDPGSTQYCLDAWTGPVVFCGWEVGNVIISGGQELKGGLTPESPVYRAFELYNNFAGRPSWDQVAILLLTPQASTYFTYISNGHCVVEPDGSNRWQTGIKSNHSYIALTPGTDSKEISDHINAMLKKK